MVLAGLLFHVVLFCFTAGPFFAPALHQTISLLKNMPSIFADQILFLTQTLSSTRWLPFPTLPLPPPPPDTYHLYFIDVAAPLEQPFNESEYIYHEGFEPFPASSKGTLNATWKGKYGLLFAVALLLDIILVWFVARVCTRVVGSFVAESRSFIVGLCRSACDPSVD